MIDQMLSNWVCWAILLLALICYQQLWSQFLILRGADDSDSVAAEAHFATTLIGALPLLGLLGTIIGLLDCFAGIAREGATGALLSGGIADALLTTQLGLVCAVPGWLLQGYLRGRITRAQLISAK